MVPLAPGRLAKWPAGNNSPRLASAMSSALIFSSEARVTPSVASMARTRPMRSATELARCCWTGMLFGARLAAAGFVQAFQGDLAAEKADADLRIARDPARRG